MRGHTCRRSGLKTRNDCSSRQLHVVLVTLHGPPELPPQSGGSSGSAICDRDKIFLALFPHSLANDAIRRQQRMRSR